MKKILMVGMSDDRGGIETYLMNVFRNIDRHRYEFWFTSACNKLCFEDEIINLGGKIVNVNGSRHNYALYKRAWEQVFIQKYDAVFFNTCDLVAFDVLKFAKKTGVPVRIVHSHNAGREKKLNIIHRFEEKYHQKHIESFATGLWACSAVAGDWMFGKKPYQIITNGIDAESFQFSNARGEMIRKELAIGTNDLVVCMVGRLAKQKNPVFAVDVISHVIKKRPESVLLIVGEGELQEAVKLHALELNVADRVIMTGVRNDISQILSAANIYLMPSSYEGLPFALIEAQASGLPCVVSGKVSEEANIAGLVNYVPLEAPPDTWADAILNAKASERKYAFKQIIQNGYDIKSTIRIIEDVIEGKCDESSGSCLP